MRHMRLMMVGLGILGVLAAGGCASTTDGAVDASPSASGTADPSQASSTASSPTQSSPAATGGSPVRTESSSSDPAPADPVTPKCANTDLKAGYRATDAGAGSRFGEITLTNVSDQACALGGFGGLSYVGGGDGTQVGAPAAREGKWRTVIMKPGQVAVSEISESTAENYPASDCRPTEVDGFRVFVPDSYDSQFVRHRTTGCADKNVSLLSHHAFH
ncbi:Protein of unknown function [Nocardioides sp. YR527]|nr:Protein of unknown function [Nocardioides sp. YR527]